MIILYYVVNVATGHKLRVFWDEADALAFSAIWNEYHPGPLHETTVIAE